MLDDSTILEMSSTKTLSSIRAETGERTDLNQAASMNCKRIGQFLSKGVCIKRVLRLVSRTWPLLTSLFETN